MLHKYWYAVGKISVNLPGNCGQVFYARKDSILSPDGQKLNIGDRRKVWKCDTRENMQFEEVPVLKGYSTSPSLYRNIEGILIADNNGTLYQYQEGQEALRELLRWEDSDMYVSGISEIAVLDEEKLLLTDDIQKKELYLLKRTSADELPERGLF